MKKKENGDRDREFRITGKLFQTKAAVVKPRTQ